MFKTQTQTKISVYKTLIKQLDLDLENVSNNTTKLLNNLENYKLIYDTLKKYNTILQTNVTDGNITQDYAQNVLGHVTNIKTLFIEHENNIKTSINRSYGNTEMLGSYRKKLINLLANENKILQSILDGNINEQGAYTGPAMRRPVGVRPEDPLVARKNK